MSNLQDIIMHAKKRRPLWVRIPESEWPRIAAQCKAPEIAELRARIEALEQELESTPDWDGDTQDDINRAKYFFKQLIELAGNQECRP